MNTPYQFYFDKDIIFLIEEEKPKHHPFFVEKYAKMRLRMYANLYCRSVRSLVIKPESVCADCGTTKNLQVDHIKPIAKGGRNELSNLQPLCKACNRKKGVSDGKR